MSKNESQKALEDAKGELAAARETARLKLHLLSLDARRAWDELEGKFQSFRRTSGRPPRFGREAIAMSNEAAAP